MPIGTGSDQDRVDIGAVEQLAKVANHHAILIAVALVDSLLRGDAADFLDVADCHELGIFLLQEAAEVVGTPIADPDAPHHNSLARRHRAVFAEGGGGDNHGSQSRGGGRAGRLQKPAAMNFLHLLGHGSNPTCWAGTGTARTP